MLLKNKKQRRMTLKRKIIKVISIILCICFLVGTISVSADVTTSSEKEIKNPTVNVKKEDKKADSKYLLGTEELKTAKLEKTEIPELITQEQIEENKHVNRLYDLEDENSVVFQNRDGTETLYTFADPIQYKDSKGKLHDKKRTLKVSDSEEYAYEITTSNVKSYYPNEISTEKGIMVKDEDNKISMKPLYSQEKNNELKGQAKNSIKKEARTSIAKKISKKNSNQDCNGVDYNETFGEGTRVRYTPTYSGIKEDIIIDSPECENRYSFEVDTGDLVAVKKDGYINFLDPLTGEKEAEISPVYIYDSAEIPNVSTDGYYEIEKKSEGKYIVTLVADESFLNSDSTVYPVYLDPSLGLNFGVSVINDAILYKGTGTIDKITKKATIGRSPDKYGCGRLLICFSKLESSNATYKAITDSSRIKNASLSLYMFGDTKDSLIRPVLYEYDWLQMYNNSECGSYGVKIGWNAFKALNDMPAKTVKTTSTVDKQTFDVTPAVKYWKDQSVYTAKTGLMIKVKNKYETNTNYSKQVYTANKSDYKPSLVITYNRNLTLDKTNVTINQGETSRLTATLQPETNVNDLVFVSSNSDIVTIDNRSDSIAGQIVKSSVNLNGVGYGTTTVIVTSKKNPEWFKTCTVTVKNPDPLHPSNINYIRYTRIPSSGTSHLLCVISSSLQSDNIFSVTNENNGTSKNYLVTNSLKNQLNSLENAYNSHLIPITQCSVEEAAAHAAKEETDQLVTAGYIQSNSSEYYGSWACNFEVELELYGYWTDIIDKATLAYGIFLAVSGYYYSSLANGANTTVYSSEYTSIANQVDEIATKLTNNPNSNKVMLGTSDNNITWFQAGSQQGMTYFYTPNWDSYVAEYGDDMMRAINKQFLYKQKLAGKQFCLSHDPIITLNEYSDSNFAMELNWLKESYGLTQLTKSNFTKEGSYWCFKP